jgi:pimeloyl-ACP methyl ester carboxylesterase
LAVPLDHFDPAGPTIDLALLRRRARTTRVGVLIVNPGGPGGSGVQFASDAGDSFPPEFDVIGFDPRGVWRSHPIDCITDADQDASWQHRQLPGTSELEQWLTENEQQVARCLGDDLTPHVGTNNVARDIEAIRRALGEEQINYLGFSYGGRIGLSYAALFPTRVRAMVLDAPQDPTASMAELIVQQAEAAQRQFDDFVAYCSRPVHGVCPADPTATVRTVMDQAETAPIPTSGGRPHLSGQLVVFGVLMSLLSPDLYPDLALALVEAKRGDGDGLVDLASIQSGRQPNGYADRSDAQALIGCADTVERPTVEDFQQLTTTVSSQSLTLFGPRYPGLMPYCWAVPPAHDPTPTPTSAIPPILIVSSTGDWPAPYEGAVHLADLLGDAVLLTREGPGHASYGANDCVIQHVDRYLRTLQPPNDGTTCR